MEARCVAVLSLALVSVPFAALAAGASGEAVDLVVDGSVHSHTSQDVAAAPALGDVSPAAEVNPDVTVRVRTTDLVLPNPAPAAARAAQAPLPERPVSTDADGIVATTGPARLVVPWYYMMDSQSIRPYDALFWDTGTAWYKGFADEVWTDYAGIAVPGPSPLTSLAGGTPDARVRTMVEEIDLGAHVDVLLRSTLAPTNLAAWQRGVASVPAARAGTWASGEPDAPALGWEGGMPARAAHAPLATEPGARLEPASVTGLLAPVAAGPVGAAALAAGSLLLGFALYHLIKKNAILKNKVRSAIAEQVLANPGSTITEIAAAVGVTHQTASYHLRLLQEHGLVIGVERGNKRLYFRNDGSFNQEERGLVAVLRDPESMRVLELVRTNPWIMKNEAALALGVSRNTLNWHLQKLLAAGLVSEARENGHCFLFCNKQANGLLLGTVAQKVEERRGLMPPGDPVVAAAPPRLDANTLGNAA